MRAPSTLNTSSLVSLPQWAVNLTRPKKARAKFSLNNHRYLALKVKGYQTLSLRFKPTNQRSSRL